jgi:hypothetical protein
MPAVICQPINEGIQLCPTQVSVIEKGVHDQVMFVSCLGLVNRVLSEFVITDIVPFKKIIIGKKLSRQRGVLSIDFVPVSGDKVLYECG